MGDKWSSNTNFMEKVFDFGMTFNLMQNEKVTRLPKNMKFDDVTKLLFCWRHNKRNDV